MDGLHISLFGNMRIAHGGQPQPVKVTHNTQILLAYLLLHSGRYSQREVLADLLWGEHPRDRARNCLSTTLWRLRSALEPHGVSRGTYLVTTPFGEVGFNWGTAHWLDVEAFEQQVGQWSGKTGPSLEEGQVHQLEHALQLYSGDLLEGFYDDWVLRERERLRALYLNGLTRLMAYYKRHDDYDACVLCGQKILLHEPIREEIHRELMRVYVASGQRALAIRQYKACCQILATTLEVSPMEETQALYAHIAAGMDPPSSSPLPSVRSVSWQKAIEQFQLATQAFVQAQEHLLQAIRFAEQSQPDL